MGNFNLGIPSNGFEYQKISSKQNQFEEFKKSIEFFNNIFKRDLSSIAPELVDENMSIKFINYGDTQLVYVLLIGNKYYTILLGQPATEFGAVKEEFENLSKLAQQNPKLVVKPNYYFANENREMYIAPYHFQARCIANQKSGWGVYIPEPYYRFELFSDEEKHMVNICIIANLISVYNETENLGLSSCKIGGGDFILERNKSTKTIDNILAKMKLIAARKLINVKFDEYIELLKKEFLLNTYYGSSEEQNHSILINQKSRVPMDKSDIEKGIQLGLKLRYK